SRSLDGAGAAERQLSPTGVRANAGDIGTDLPVCEGAGEASGTCGRVCDSFEENMRVSHIASDRAVRILCLVCRFSACLRVLQEMVEVGVVSKLCLMIQVDSGERTKDRVKQILALHSKVMLDTVGAKMQVVNKSEKAISLQQDDNVILTPGNGQEAISQVLPINFDGLAKAVKKGDTIFVGQYLFTGSETTSIWLEVRH
ncbi:pyruvate kinase, partial [Tanacetum coccineum]